MLSPDSRRTALEMIRAPVGYRLDFAVLTTYTLDLEALLALPLSTLSHPDGGLEELLAEPLKLYQAIQKAGDRVHAFVDATGIGVPRRARPLYSMLESSVHAVRAPTGGAFHPKVWAARFTATDETEPANDRLRVVVLSRNLTFDRSWDIALTSEATPRGRRVAASRPLSDLLRALPGLAGGRVPRDVTEHVQELADQAARCTFPAPDGFDSPVAFHALGLSQRRTAWRPPSNGNRVLAMAPFVNRTGLDAVRGFLGGGERILVSRQDELDRLSEDALAEWDQVYVLADTAQGEPEDPDDRENGASGADAGPDDRASDRGADAEDGPGRVRPAATRTDDDRAAPDTDAPGARPSGLHAKMIAVEHGWDVTWYAGSANLTAAAFGGGNVEMMASITGKKGRKATGHGIDRFFDSGFEKLCVTYERTEPADDDPEDVMAARERLEMARDALVDADLRVICARSDELWTLTVDGDADLPADVEVVAWPVSVAENHARPLNESPRWRLPVPRLTAFIAFRLRVPVHGVDDVRMTLRLPDEGMPPDRVPQILRSLLDSPEKFLAFLRALLGDLDAVFSSAQDGAGTRDPVDWGVGIDGETLLEVLVRTASRNPDKLKPVRDVIHDLRKTKEGRRIVPDNLFSVWTAVEEALAREPRS